ncbi:MAG: peptidylprolyl isomerase [Pseudomonas sp.]
MACGCGGTSEGGGCGSSPPLPEVAQLVTAQFEELPREIAQPVADVAAEPQLIASSEQDWPRLSVNEVFIDPQAVAQELQYHPAESQAEAAFFAARALVIRELLRQRVAELGLPLAVESDESEEEAATRLLIEQEVKVPFCDEETCQRYYQSNLGRFFTAPLLAVRHILLECPPEDAEARSLGRDQAEQLVEQLRQDGGRFAELAARHSFCSSKAQGGALGQISKGQCVPEFERQLFLLPAGLAERPIESRYGWHVVTVDQRLEGQQLPYEVVAGSIRAQLQQGVWQTAVAQYLQTLIGAADIVGIQLQGADSPLVQ